MSRLLSFPAPQDRLADTGNEFWRKFAHTDSQVGKC